MPKPNTYRLSRYLLFAFTCLSWHGTFGQEAGLTEKNKSMIKSYIEVVVNGHNLDRKPDFFAADYIWYKFDGTGVKQNPDSSHTSTLRWLFNAIPDVRYSIDVIEAGGDMVGITTTATGTARSEMFGLPAAQKKVTYTQMFLYLLKNGKIIAQWEVVDVDAITAQLKKTN